MMKSTSPKSAVTTAITSKSQRIANLLTSKNLKTSLILLYILAVLGFSVSSRAQVSIFPFPNKNQVQVKTLVGDVVATLDGSMYLIVSESEFYEIASEHVDLTEFNGLTVKIKAYESFKKVGPVLTLQTINLDGDLAGEFEKKNAPLLVVIGISELVE